MVGSNPHAAVKQPKYGAQSGGGEVGVGKPQREETRAATETRMPPASWAGQFAVRILPSRNRGTCTDQVYLNDLEDLASPIFDGFVLRRFPSWLHLA